MSMMREGSRRGREIIRCLVHKPRRTFTKKQIEEHNLGIILILMSSLFIFCQSFKIIPDMYEIFQCNRLGKYGGNCEMKGPVCTNYMYVMIRYRLVNFFITKVVK